MSQLQKTDQTIGDRFLDSVFNANYRRFSGSVSLDQVQDLLVSEQPVIGVRVKDYRYKSHFDPASAHISEEGIGQYIDQMIRPSMDGRDDVDIAFSSYSSRHGRRAHYTVDIDLPDDAWQGENYSNKPDIRLEGKLHIPEDETVYDVLNRYDISVVE